MCLRYLGSEQEPAFCIGNLYGACPEQAIHENYADKMWARVHYASNRKLPLRKRGKYNISNLNRRGAKSTVYSPYMCQLCPNLGMDSARLSEVT